MREHVESVLADRRQDLPGDIRWVEPGLHKFDDMGRHCGCPALRVRRPPRPVALRPVARTFADTGANPPGTQHAHANAERLELRRESLRHGHDRELARRVRTEPKPADHPGHGSGVDEVAAFAMGADVRQESADAVKHAHQVDVEHPAPVVERNVVNAAATGDAGIVADHMDISECLV